MTTQNLIAWAIQVSVIASLGALLPVVFRIRHPKTHLAWCHFVLACCAFLPLIEPWSHPIVNVAHSALPAGGSVVSVSHPAIASRPGFAWREILLDVLIAGMAAKLCWIAAGLWTLRRYRLRATPLSPIPDSVMAATDAVGIDALVCVSADSAGPVTFGFLEPVILVPQSFFKLSPDAQRAVVSHELLHVRRRDWLVMLAEEIAGALLWFQPAIWWLLGQARLVREQLVDAEVVRLIPSRKSYMEALIAIAGLQPALDLAPAPLFLRKRHLNLRLHSLLEEFSMSRLRLSSSYFSMTAILAASLWLVLLSFPLVGQPQAVPAAGGTDSTGVTVDAGGTLLHRSGVTYPADAFQKQIAGIVTAQVSLNRAGEVVDARILSGPEELRATVLRSVLQWHYAGAAAGSRQVTVTFQAPPAQNPQDAARQLEARNRAEEAQRASNLQMPTLQGIDVKGLPEPIREQVAQRVQSFVGQPLSGSLMSQVQEAVRESDSHIQLRPSTSPDRQQATLILAVPNVSPAGAIAQTAPNTIKVGGAVQAANVLTQTAPVYPPLARSARIQGVVHFNTRIGKDGTVQNIELISGHPLLVQSARDAVQQWTYKPTLLNGEPVEVLTQVDVNFTLSGEPFTPTSLPSPPAN